MPDVGNRISELKPLTRAAVLGISSVLLLSIGSFCAFRLVGSGSVLGDVRVNGVELGSQSMTEATATIDRVEETLIRTPLLLEIDGRTTDVTGDQLGASVADDLVDRAMANGRSGSMLSQFAWWVGSLFSGPVELDTGFALDPAAVETLADAWDEDLIGAPPFPGAIIVSEGVASPEYPRIGTSVDRTALVEILESSLVAGVAEPVAIPTNTTVPGATEADIDAAVARANLWISNPITLTVPDGSLDVVFSAANLATALMADVDLDGSIELGFDEAIIDSRLLNQRDGIEAAPVDAKMEIDGYQVVIVPGRNGTLIDAGETTAILESLADTSSRRGTLPIQEGAEPTVKTADLEALGIEHMVVQFTTYHDCCGARVDNIQLMADTIDGAIVKPGEVFGINAFVGRRTIEDGYQDAGTIIRGEIVETVGGGVSQFATTLYNTVFWGGYEDVEHKPHSFYFSRYPEGIESTVSYPQPEMSFRNNTDKSIMIKTSHTDTSITVRIYGANDGRIIAGAHRDGRTSFETIAEGGPNARRVRGSVSDRTDFTEPTTEYRANPALGVDEQDETQSARQGWTVFVTRTIEAAGGVTENSWTVRYLAQRQIIEVHPCKVPGTSTPCPTTTTTTTTPPTTLPPETSTTLAP